MQWRKVIGVRRFLMQLQDIATSGYDVWGEMMLGRRWKCSRSCSKTWLYSSAVTMPVECFIRCPCALWGDRVVRKYWARSVRGMVGGQDDVVMFGRMWWNHFRMRECGLVMVE